MNKSRINIARILISISMVAIIGGSHVFAAENSQNKGLELKGDVKIDSYSNKINLSLRNTDIKQVLRLLADKAGLNVVIHENVKGLVSIDLVNISLNKAFEYVMTMNGLSYLKDGKTLIVAPKGVSDTLGMSKRKIKPISIKYMDALSVAGFLNQNIFSLNRPDLSSGPIVITNPRTNQIYIFGNDEDFAIAEKTASMLDVKPIIKTFNISYSNSTLVAGNICNMVFNTNFFVQGNGGGPGASGGGASGSGASGGGASGSGASGGGASGSSGKANGFNLICGQRSTATGSNTNNNNQGGGSQNSLGSTGSQNFGLSSVANVIPSTMANSNNTNNNANTLSGAGSFTGLTSTLMSLDVLGYAVFANDEVSQINVMGTDQQIKLAEELIKKMDKRPLQAFFDISILEVNETNNKDFDMALSIVNKYVDNLNLNGANGLVYSKTNKLPTTMTSLLTTTKGKILANPKLIVPSNTTSQFNVTQKEGGPVSVTSTPSNVTNDPVLTYSIGASVDTGIKVSLTPVIKPNGQISLSMTTAYITLLPEKVAGNATKNTQVTQTLTAQRDFTLTDVILKDGETFVLGGLISENELKSRNKPSWFGSIPFIGGIFGKTQNNKNRSELIFIITPHIVKDPDNFPSSDESL